MAARRAAAKKAEEDALREKQAEATRVSTERFEGGSLRQFFKHMEGGRWLKSEWFDPEYEPPKEEKKEEEGEGEEEEDLGGGVDSPVMAMNSVSTLGVDGIADSSMVTSEVKSEEVTSLESGSMVEGDSMVEDDGEDAGTNDAEVKPQLSVETTESKAASAARKASMMGNAPKSPTQGPTMTPEETPPPGTWPGITSVRRRVVKIDLHENGLGGQLPGAPGTGIFPVQHTVPPSGDSVLLLGNLKVCVLFGNDIFGPLPASWGKFDKMQHLDLSHNHLEGDVPHEIFDIKTLKRLHLEDNAMLTGTIPDTLCELEGLEAFTVHNNRLDGELPQDLGKLQKLTEFSVHHNRLSGPIPESLKEIKGLTRLFLSDNNFAEPGKDLMDEIREAGTFPLSPRTGADLNCTFLPQKPEGVYSEDEPDSEEEEDESMTIDGSQTYETEET